MGLIKFVKNVAKSTILTATGVASTAIEYVGAFCEMDVVEDIGHSLKSASFNGIRRTWGAKEKEYGHSIGNAARESSANQQRKMEQLRREADIKIKNQKPQMNQKYEEVIRKINDDERNGRISHAEANARRAKVTEHKERIRRTEEELSKDKTGTDRNPASFDHRINVPLPIAMEEASSEAGVYILYLNGAVMKCGRSSQIGGVRKRLQEYHRLDYDKRAKAGEHWAVNKNNRNEVYVSWQCCPVCKCHELEYKLFKKHGKGAWAHRAPLDCVADTWPLLI